MKGTLTKWLGLAIAVAFCGIVLSYGVTQEVPIGRVKGSVVMDENGKPLSGAMVTLSRIGKDDDDTPQAKGVETSDDGTFVMANVPAGPYEVAVSAEEHNLGRKIVSIREGETLKLRLRAKPIDPYLNLYSSQKVFTPDETPRVEVHGFVPQKDLRLTVYRLDLEQIAKKGGYQEAIYPLAQSSTASKTKLDKAGTMILDDSRVVVDRDAEGAFVDTLPVGRQKDGVYLVKCTAGDRSASTVLLISQLALVTKTAQGKSLCYTTDLKTGRPIGGVQILCRQGDELRPSGVTDSDGIATVDLGAGTNDRVVLMARRGDSVALIGTYGRSASQNGTWVDGYCDRPAYRPGDQVFFKGYVRKSNNDGYDLPGSGTVNVEIRDPDDNVLRKMELPLSPHGSFHGDFTTSAETKPGSYGIVCRSSSGGQRTFYANVVAYRKPEFDITVKPVKERYTMGDRAAAVVECKYYYGGPVVGAKVKASIYRSPAFNYTDENGEDQVGESYGGGEYSEEVEAITDASGRATIEFDTRGKNDPDVFTNDYDYNVSASVTEDDSKYFNGEGVVRVVRGDFDLQMDVQNPVLQRGDTVDLLIKTTDPLDSSKPAPNRQVFVDAGREEWTQSTSVFVPRQRYRAFTDASGVGHLHVPVDRSQSIAFRATATDEEGHKIIASAYAYVVGSPAMADAQKGDLKVTLDKRHYADGETARALVQTDMPGGTALVCLQSDRVIWRKLVTLTTGSTLVDVPVRKEFAPNVYVSVAYVREKHFLQTDRRLRVERQDHTLKVAVTSDRQAYRPGETARVRIRTTDVDGKPVPAEISVSVVDQGIYAVAEDNADLYASLYPERGNEVSTDYSFPEIYLDGGDKGTSKIPLRTNFKDTAAWMPVVWTGDRGETTVTLTLPDNLTEWRVTARGLSDESQAGHATTAFRVRKELMLRLQLPQYLVSGDRQRMTVVVANDTGRDQDVHVQLDASGIAVDGERDQVLRVPNGEPQVVEMFASAGRPGPATLTARAWIDSGPSDGVQQRFPILSHGRRVTDTRSGEGSAEFQMPTRRSLDPNAGSLTIRLSPTIAGNIVTAMDGLIDFPYGCVEQTMSRFMPSVLVAQSFRELGLPAPKRANELPKIVADSLARLDDMRHPDGGWGWWDYDDSTPFMTALVLDGLDRARSAGYDVSRAGPEKAVSYGLKLLSDPKAKVDDRDRLYLAYTLMRWGKREAAQALPKANLRERTVEEFGRKVRYPRTADLATAVLAYSEANQSDMALKVLDRLRKRAHIGQEEAYWAPEEDAWGEEATALALVAFEKVKPNDTIVPLVVRHLMAARQGSMWYSTRDTAYVLVGLTAYLRSTHELESSSTATVTVNGSPKGTFVLDPKVLEDPKRTITIPRSELGSGPVQVHIKATGSGRCYYTATLDGLEVGSPLAPTSTDGGLRIMRQYFRMEPQRLENGDLKLLPSKRPVTRFQNGDIVRVVLTINTDRPREYVLVEEPTPSSCRVTERVELDEYESWDWWWSQTVMMDDHLAFFARNVPKGKSEITYNMRAEQAGVASALPTTVRNMYDPGRWASGGEAAIEVNK